MSEALSSLLPQDRNLLAPDAPLASLSKPSLVSNSPIFRRIWRLRADGTPCSIYGASPGDTLTWKFEELSMLRRADADAAASVASPAAAVVDATAFNAY